MVLYVSEGIVIGWECLESTKLGLVHTSVMDSRQQVFLKLEPGVQLSDHKLLFKTNRIIFQKVFYVEYLSWWTRWKHRPVKDGSRLWMERKQIFFRNSFLRQIDFHFNLLSLHPTQWFISIFFQPFEPRVPFSEENMLMMRDCGQEKDKAATSQTLKLCRKRKGGKVGFLHLRH